MKQKSARRIWGKIGISVLVVLVGCTFLSRTIQTALLPQVETVAPSSDSIGQEIHAKGTVTYGETQDVFWPVELKVLEVLVRKGATVAKGDALLRVDLSEYELTRMEYENQMLQLKNTLARRPRPDARTRAELEGQLAILQKRTKNLRSQYPKKGLVTAPCDGKITGLAAQAGKSYPGQTALLSIVPADAPLSVEFTLSAEELGVFAKDGAVAIEYNAVTTTGSSPTPAKLVTALSRQVFDPETQQYLCYADLKGAPLELGQRVDVTLTQAYQADTYDTVIPRGAVFETDTGDAIYVLDKRDGLFGEETYVRSVRVEVAAQNDLSCAVYSQEALRDVPVVVSSTRPLTQGQTVTVNP